MDVEIVGASGAGFLVDVLKSIFRSPFKTTVIEHPAVAEVAEAVGPGWGGPSLGRTLAGTVGMATTLDHLAHAPASRAPRKAGPPKIPPPVGSHFKLVFLSVLGLTIACIIGALALTLLHDPLNDNQQRIFEALVSTFIGGVGAVFGLIGGKAIS